MTLVLSHCPVSGITGNIINNIQNYDELLKFTQGKFYSTDQKKIYNI